MIEPDLSGAAAAAREVVDATGLLVLPGVIDVHTHTRVASDDEPDRFFQDSVAAAHGGTTTFLAFNNPGTGSSPAAQRSILTGIEEFRRITADDAAVDFGLSAAILGGMDDPDRRAPGDGRRRRADGKGVHGLRLPAGRSRDLRRDARARGARRDAAAPLRRPGVDRYGDRSRASAW
jgi:dihydroorotase-like cyclic amidohydrolase